MERCFVAKVSQGKIDLDGEGWSVFQDPKCPFGCLDPSISKNTQKVLEIREVEPIWFALFRDRAANYLPTIAKDLIIEQPHHSPSGF